MFIEDFNLYRLLIPFFLAALSSIILLIRCFKAIPSYFSWYAIATFLVAIALFLLNTLQPQILPLLSFIPITFLLCACALLSYVIALRLRLNSHIGFMLFIIVLSDLAYSYYIFINESYASRMLVMTVAVFLIFAHNFKAMFQAHLVQSLDRYLRVMIIIIVMLISLRSLYLFTVVGANNTILSNPTVTASTQLMLLFLIASTTILLYGAFYQDIITRLNIERNTDALTGLLNRRAIFELLENMKKGDLQPHTMILCDIDHFKKINDQYGHHVGDLALKHISQILNQNTRQADQVSRLGGEEFIIILPNTAQEMAICIAERLRKIIEITPIHHQNQQISLTVSFGVAEFDVQSNFDQHLQKTDLLLYQAKKFGRNKVEWQLQL